MKRLLHLSASTFISVLISPTILGQEWKIKDNKIPALGRWQHINFNTFRQ